MEFYVYSRYGIEALEPHDVPHVIVSITTPGDPALPAGARIKTNEHTLGLLRLTFHDLDRIVPGTEELESELFQPEQARKVLALVKANPEAQRFIVHCDAGLSRSPAVAAALSKILTGDDASFRQYHPNMLVYRTLLEEHYASDHTKAGD